MAIFRAYIRTWHSLLLLMVSVSVIGTVEHCFAMDEGLDVQRGAVISVEVLEELSEKEIATQLKAHGIPGRPEYGVTRYRIAYQTVDHAGQATIASGAVVVPIQYGQPMPLLSFQHGTTVARERAPSEQDIDLIGMGLGTSGYVTAFPDYLGLGSNKGLHPYVHARSLSTAIVDFLRAVRTFCADQDILLNEQLFLMGYSEGGYATLAAHRTLQEVHSAEFTVTASAPMAGPYHLSGVMMESILSGKPYPSPMYLPFTLLAYNQVYDFYDRHEEVFKPAYAMIMDSLFSGTLNLHEINEALPAVPLEMLREEFVEALRSNQDHPVRKALEENDLHQWAPRAPVRLIHCKGDDQVAFANAEVVLKGFAVHGASQVELVALDYGNHEECAPPSILIGKMWFDQFKKEAACPVSIAEGTASGKECQIITTENRAAPSDL